MNHNPILVLGAMPLSASHESHIAAGPWCFAGQEDKFPAWESKFTFAPEPLADKSLAPLAARAAQGLCVRCMPKLAPLLCAEHQDFAPVYWQTLLAPWAMDVSRQIIEHALRVQAMLQKWRDISLRVQLLPAAMDFNFQDEHDFSIRGGLGTDFTHWLFSRLLENCLPENWQVEYLPAQAPNMPAAAQKPTLRGILRAKARDLLLNLPFPKLKGMSLKQAFKYSAALAHVCRTADHSLDLEQSFAADQELQKIPLPADLLAIFEKALPESIRKLRHAPPKTGQNRPRLRVASIIAYENAPYRQKLALWRQKGGRLAYAQHGGNYGQIRVACDTELVEYSQAVFFTWGWKKQGTCKGNFLPMPYPQLANIANKWHGSEAGGLLFTGTEMAAFAYRLDSRPTPLQFVAYRQAKAEFFRALDSQIRSNCQYRPYFSLPGTLEDANWLLPQFPELRLCTGPLLPHMLACNLMVLDHHGTTMLEAFAANIPLVLYWNRKDWPLTDEANELLDMLHEAGIWQESPAAAAKKVNEIWPDTAAWWQSDRIQKARRLYCKSQALLPEKDLDQTWTAVLKTL